jgi:hypothetical protein
VALPVYNVSSYAMALVPAGAVRPRPTHMD